MIKIFYLFAFSFACSVLAKPPIGKCLRHSSLKKLIYDLNMNV